MKNDSIEKSIIKAVSLGAAFYAYKLPDIEQFYFGVQIDDDFKSDIGFRIVPFLTAEYPIRTIYAQLSASEFLKQNTYGTENPNFGNTISINSTDYTDYIKYLTEIISNIRLGNAEKVVMSKIIVRSHNFKAKYWCDLFFELAGKYHNAFTFFFYTKETGAWIGATPEVLGTYDNRIFQTMALAGTRKSGTTGNWSAKDIGEQEYVVDYIRNTIINNQLDYDISPKFTKKAGVVEHLCNIFTVNDCNKNQAEHLITELHPTPALAGFPKEKAINLIQKFELHNREYYGGYIGPFSSIGFKYFVNLRSMKIDNSKYEIFVGGGIVKDSTPEKEWNETENKSQTILSLIH